MNKVESQLLDQLTEKARLSPRLRMNYNLHGSNESACHRLFNAMEPDSYVRPHRHLDVEKDETYILIRGRLGVICFDSDGSITDTALLIAGTDQVVVNIPHGMFHTAVSLQPGTIFFEAKAGPYRGFSDTEKSAWAPEEGSTEAGSYHSKLCALFNS